MTDCTCDPKLGDCCRCEACHQFAPHDRVMEIARRIIERDAELLKRLADDD